MHEYPQGGSKGHDTANEGRRSLAEFQSQALSRSRLQALEMTIRPRARPFHYNRFIDCGFTTEKAATGSEA